MATYRTPGVYVEEVSTLPPSVAEVATAVPAFIGYTETGSDESAAPVIKRITSLLEYTSDFGVAQPSQFNVIQQVDASNNPTGIPYIEADTSTNTTHFSLYYALSHYFKNGGGPCYVVALGSYSSNPSKERFIAGLTALESEDEPTLIVPTEAAGLLTHADYYEVCGAALAHCKKMGDRFTIIDVHQATGEADPITTFRDNPNLSINLMYGAAYHPYLLTSVSYGYEETGINVIEYTQAYPPKSIDLGGDNGISVSYSGPVGSEPAVEILLGTLGTDPVDFSINNGVLTISNALTKTGLVIVDAWDTWKATTTNNPAGFDILVNGTGADVVQSVTNLPITAIPIDPTAVTTQTLDAIKDTETVTYNLAKTSLADKRVVLPPSAAMAGIYARTDREQGVWKSPANTGVLGVLGPVTKITDDMQNQLNVDATAGKSINAIRAFTGKGTLVWGGRTLAGNDNEWRYVSVRRLFITIEESTRKASAFAVFEANDQTTWLKVKAMIESYLYGLWEQGALAGSKSSDAYYVNVGLGTTMTPQDILEGRMIVEIGIAAVRPAEFIILRFSHKLQTA